MNSNSVDAVITELAGCGIELRAAGLDEQLATTYHLQHRVEAIVRPANACEAAQVCRVLAAHNVEYSVTANGLSWGYGNRHVVEGARVLISTEKITDIRDFDRALGVVTIGPGITFRQLNDFLIDSPFWISGPGSSADASVVGNSLARGHGVGWDVDRKPPLRYEGILPDGTWVETAASDSFVEALDDRLFGPNLSPLVPYYPGFVVTGATIALSRRGRCITALGGLSDEGLISVLQRLPRHHARVPTSLVCLYHAERRLLYGQVEKPSHEWDAVIKIGAHSRLAVIDGLVSAATVVGPSVLRRRGMFRLDLSRSPRGQIANEGLTSLYGPFGAPRRTGRPELDGSGVLFCNAVTPLHADSVANLSAELHRIASSFDFPFALTLRVSDPRTCRFVLPLVYPRGDDRNDDRARECFHACTSAVLDAGGRPFRVPSGVGSSWGELFPRQRSTVAKFASGFGRRLLQDEER